ncbi:MAG: murein hydrolase activator EnvC family protein [Acidimicrobiia bacterium]
MRRFWRSQTLTVFALAVWVLAGSVPAFGGGPEDTVEEARRERERAAAERADARDELEAAVEEYQQVNSELEQLVYGIGRLRFRIEDYESELSGLRETARDRAVQAYIEGGTDFITMLFESEALNEVVAKQEVLEHAVERDLAMLDDLAVTRRQLDRLREQLREDEARTRQLHTQAEELVERLDELFHRAEEAYRQADELLTEAEAELAEHRRRQEEERRRRRLLELARQSGAAAGVSPEVTPGFICPVQGPVSFINDWGFPRSGGRTHKGTDLFAPRGTDLVAVGDGVVSTGTGRLGGITTWLRADHGVSYYYAHLDGYAPGIGEGTRVTRGQVVGYVGDTGNARGGAYHLHFGIYPGGNSAVNPYPTVLRNC